MMAPPKLPKPLLTKLRHDVITVLNKPDVRKRIMAAGGTPGSAAHPKNSGSFYSPTWRSGLMS
jgi:hypothetical protein